VQEGAELREVQRPKPGPKPRQAKAAMAPALPHETAPLPAAIPEPEAPSEDALQVAEELAHHERQGLAEAAHAAHEAHTEDSGRDGHHEG
jgi:hypothetical protein